LFLTTKGFVDVAGNTESIILTTHAFVKSVGTKKMNQDEIEEIIDDVESDIISFEERVKTIRIDITHWENKIREKNILLKALNNLLDNEQRNPKT